MRLISKLLVAASGILVLGGVAVAAERKVHILNVAMPDGTVRQIRYTGEVAPRVILVPVAGISASFDEMDAQFRLLDRAVADMDRRMAAMRRQAAAVRARRGNGPVTQVVVRSVPAGTVRYSFVSMNNGAVTCSRSTQITSRGPDQAPKAIEQVSGDCGVASGARKPASNRSGTRASPTRVKAEPVKRPAQQTIKVRDTV